LGLEIRAVAEGELGALSGRILESSRDYSIWLFYGEMGAGKTALIRHLCAALGVTDAVNSPSFNIIHEYRTAAGRKIYHFDFYRLRKEEEALDLGIEEYFDSGELCMIEWPERIPSLLPERYVAIELRIGPDAVRSISLNHHG
jgi:tRNA threonylcarbamoyladenosine biosynthesis protein TsaE